MKTNSQHGNNSELKIQNIKKLKNFPLENKFIIKNQIARGEFGHVFEAIHNVVDGSSNTVVVKITQCHQTNNNEIEFLEKVKKNMAQKQKLYFPTIISNGLVEIDDQTFVSWSKSNLWSYIVIDMLGDTVESVFSRTNKITIPVALQIGI